MMIDKSVAMFKTTWEMARLFKQTPDPTSFGLHGPESRTVKVMVYINNAIAMT